MRFGSAAILVNGSMSASFNSQGIDLQQDWLSSIQVNYSGIGAGASGLGTMIIQVSNDNVTHPLSGPSGSDPAQLVTNWATYSASSTSSVVGSTSYMFDLSLKGFRWARLNYTAASGSGIMSANFFGKGS